MVGGAQKRQRYGRVLSSQWVTGSPTDLASEGFTLIEILVVVALLALVVSVASITLTRVLRSDLRSAATQVAGAMRSTFDRAQTSGMRMRLTLDFSKGEISMERAVEETTGPSSTKASMSPSSPPSNPEDEREPRRSGEPSIDSAEEDSGAFGLDASTILAAVERDLEPIKAQRPRFEREKGAGVREIKLGDNIKIALVYASHLEEPVQEGRAHIYFFAQGHAEPAIVHLVSGKDTYSIILHPLIGSARVYPCKVLVSESFGKGDDLQGANETSGDLCEAA